MTVRSEKYVELLLKGFFFFRAPMGERTEDLKAGPAKEDD